MIAREGLPFILIGLAATILLMWGATRFDSKWLFASAVILGLLTLFTVFFFRDPDRSFEMADEIIVSPADGKIIGVEKGTGHPYMPGEYTKVSIFLNVFDVHINRVPASGSIDYVKYNPGKFFAAFEDKASELNEQTEIGMTTSGGNKLVFKQIAGLIARRIVCKLTQGDSVAAGARFGLIRFGSRTELFLPADAELRIKLGDHVVGGETIISQLSPRNSSQPSSVKEPSRERL
jgi:phosphatidylserine decarboxylase